MDGYKGDLTSLDFIQINANDFFIGYYDTDKLDFEEVRNIFEFTRQEIPNLIILPKDLSLVNVSEEDFSTMIKIIKKIQSK